MLRSEDPAGARGALVGAQDLVGEARGSLLRLHGSVGGVEGRAKKYDTVFLTCDVFNSGCAKNPVEKSVSLNAVLGMENVKNVYFLAGVITYCLKVRKAC